LHRRAISVAYMRRRESRGFFVIKHSFLPSVQKAHASASLH
jgi:predicted component of type VI protein secretion system